jgi:hypothetical protein
MAQAVCRRSVTTEAWVRSPAIHVEFMAYKTVVGEVSLRVLQFSPVSIIPPKLHTYISLGG